MDSGVTHPVLREPDRGPGADPMPELPDITVYVEGLQARLRTNAAPSVEAYSPERLLRVLEERLEESRR